jgi:hypothetical protein
VTRGVAPGRSAAADRRRATGRVGAMSGHTPVDAGRDDCRSVRCPAPGCRSARRYPHRGPRGGDRANCSSVRNGRRLNTQRRSTQPRSPLGPHALFGDLAAGCPARRANRARATPTKPSAHCGEPGQVMPDACQMPPMSASGRTACQTATDHNQAPKPAPSPIRGSTRPGH